MANMKLLPVRAPTSLVVLFVSLALLPAIEGLAATDISPQYWRHYRGLSYPCAAAKKPLVECEIELTANAHGLVLGERIGNLYFRVHYDRDWILPPEVAAQHNVGPYANTIVYGLRESIFTDQATKWLLFLQNDPVNLRVASIQASTILPLAIYYQDNSSARNLVSEQYQKVEAIVSDSHLQPKPTGLRKKSESASESNKDALNSAISTIQNGASTAAKVPRRTLTAAVETTISLLGDADQDLGDATKLLQQFGTTDLVRIHTLTEGNIYANQLRLLESAEDLQTNKKSWTTDHIAAMLQTLDLVAQSPGLFGERESYRAAAALKIYSKPFGDCANILEDGKMIAH